MNLDYDSTVMLTCKLLFAAAKAIVDVGPHMPRCHSGLRPAADRVRPGPDMLFFFFLRGQILIISSHVRYIKAEGRG